MCCSILSCLKGGRSLRGFDEAAFFSRSSYVSEPTEPLTEPGFKAVKPWAAALQTRDHDTFGYRS